MSKCIHITASFYLQATPALDGFSTSIWKSLNRECFSNQHLYKRGLFFFCLLIEILTTAKFPVQQFLNIWILYLRTKMVLWTQYHSRIRRDIWRMTSSLMNTWDLNSSNNTFTQEILIIISTLPAKGFCILIVRRARTVFMIMKQHSQATTNTYTEKYINTGAGTCFHVFSIACAHCVLASLLRNHASIYTRKSYGW